MPTFVVPLIIVVIAVVAGVVLFKAMWRVAEPNEAMIISGRGRKEKGSDITGPRVVLGKGTFVLAGLGACSTRSPTISTVPVD